MKLVISFDELYDYAKNCDEKLDISDYWELTQFFLIGQFPEWDINEAFQPKTFINDLENKEVSIEVRPL